ncbi:MAG: SGNH/GDSL hydrolase family protein [Rhodospirillales bacterium]
MRNLIVNTCLVLVSIAILAAGFEIGLRLFAPISVTNVGYVDRPNGELYGWGFRGNELVRIETADTGEVFYDRVNAEGWRDRDREAEKPPGTFRVLVLGDSMTFGYIVSKRKTFTWLLEDELKKHHENVEVINISYSGWGTDQAFEALKLDGARYKPDLVVYHFVSNDPQDNIWHRDDGKFGARKPFYYEAVDGVAVRRPNPRFAEEQNAITRKYIISKSEILKRLWITTEGLKHRNRDPYVHDPRHDARIRHFLDIDEDHELFRLIRDRTPGNEPFAEEIMEQIVRGAGLSAEQARDLRRILTDIPGNATGLIDGADEPVAFDDKEYWTLTEALIRTMAAYCGEIGADFAILSDTEEGRFRWDHYWRRVVDDRSAREEYFHINNFLRRAIDGTSAELIPSPEPHVRAINDSHVNVAGNVAIAENLKRYLLDRYRGKFVK